MNVCSVVSRTTDRPPSRHQLTALCRDSTLDYLRVHRDLLLGRPSRRAVRRYRVCERIQLCRSYYSGTAHKPSIALDLVHKMSREW